MHTLTLTDEELLLVGMAVYGQVSLAVTNAPTQAAVIGMMQQATRDFGIDQSLQLAERIQALAPELFNDSGNP